MNWNLVFELIDPVLFGVLGACWTIGFALKKTPKVPDWTILYIVTTISIALVGSLLGWGVESLVQGILTGAFAVYGNQFIKQVGKRGEENVSDTGLRKG